MAFFYATHARTDIKGTKNRLSILYQSNYKEMIQFITQLMEVKLVKKTNGAVDEYWEILLLRTYWKKKKKYFSYASQNWKV